MDLLSLAFAGGRRSVLVAGRRRGFAFLDLGLLGLGLGLGGGLAARGGVLAFQVDQQITGLEGIADLDVQGGDLAGLGGRDLHAGLVGLQHHQALFGLDGIADLYQQLDDFAVATADVGYADGLAHSCFLLSVCRISNPGDCASRCRCRTW